MTSTNKDQSFTQLTTTHYKSYDNLLVFSNGRLFENELNKVQKKKCTNTLKRNGFIELPLAPKYPGDLWSVFGEEGGVYKITEYDVSFYIENFTSDEVESFGLLRQDDRERSSIRFSSIKRPKPFLKSQPALNERKMYQPCPRPKDGRLVIKLEENLNDDYIKKEHIVSENFTKYLNENIHFESTGPLIYLCISFR